MKLPKHNCGLYLLHNIHKDYYQTLEDYIVERETRDGPLEWSSQTAKRSCLETDEFWYLQWYPDTPIGSYTVIGPTLEEVLAKAKEIENE